MLHLGQSQTTTTNGHSSQFSRVSNLVEKSQAKMHFTKTLFGGIFFSLFALCVVSLPKDYSNVPNLNTILNVRKMFVIHGFQLWPLLNFFLLF